jgi:hypothetical protein
MVTLHIHIVVNGTYLVGSNIIGQFTFELMNNAQELTPYKCDSRYLVIEGRVYVGTSWLSNIVSVWVANLNNNLLIRITFIIL